MRHDEDIADEHCYDSGLLSHNTAQLYRSNLETDLLVSSVLSCAPGRNNVLKSITKDSTAQQYRSQKIKTQT